MANTTTLNIRINPTVKQKAEEVLEELGIPMSTALNINKHDRRDSIPSQAAYRS